MEGDSLDSLDISGFPIEQIVLPQISLDNNKEQVKEVGVSRANQFTQQGLNEDSGAGANAGSRTDLTKWATNALSELVWSPHKGLSLKCADRSLAEKKPSILCGIGSSNMVLSPSRSIVEKGANNDGPVAEGNLSSSHIPLHKAGSGGLTEELNTTIEVSVKHIDQGDHSNKKRKHIYGSADIRTTDVSWNGENIVSSSRDDDSIPEPDSRKTVNSLSIKLVEPRPDTAQAEPSCGDSIQGESSDPLNRSRDEGNGNNHTAVVSPIKVGKSSNSLFPVSMLPEKKHETVEPIIEEEGQFELNKPIFAYSPLEIQESSSENNLQPLKGETTVDEAGIVAASEPADEVKLTPQKNEGIDPTDKAVPLEASLNSNGVHLYQRKGKEKAVSDGDVNGKTSKEKDNSNESVESCNSSGFLSTGKRQWSFEQKRVLGNKKMKQEIHESPGSASVFKQDSSFMNWISNMMKGLPKSEQDETPSLALTMGPHQGYGIRDRNFMSDDKKQDPMGFQTIFHALYCPNTRAKNTESMAYENITPIAWENDELCRKTLVSNENSNQDTPREGEGPSTLPSISSANIAQNNNLYNRACGTQRVGVNTINSSLQNDPEYLSEGREISKLRFIDPSKSLWLTRFSPKASGPILSSHQCRQSTSGDEGLNGRELSVDNQMIVVAKNLQSSEVITKVNTVKKYKSSLSPILPSQRLKNSEAMASVFARRLDALRHIIPSVAVDNASMSSRACVFCGVKGHSLLDCSEITESELEELLKNINSYEGAEEFSCLCIRCFQLNHWAIACPNTSSRRQRHSDGFASFFNYSNFGKMQHRQGEDILTKNDEKNLQQLKNKKCQYQVASALTLYNDKIPVEDDKLWVPANLNHKLSEKMILNERVADLKLVKKQITLSSREAISKENQIMPNCNFVNWQIPDEASEFFELIRRLRLSRTDVLRWMKSPMSHFCLEGFFLRLRLGKGEEGLGDTRYHVASINGEVRERSHGNSKAPLSASIRGFKCLVESRYISNHDFTEEELKAWLCTTSSSGGKLPSIGELKMKLELRKKFEF